MGAREELGGGRIGKASQSLKVKQEFAHFTRREELEKDDMWIMQSIDDAEPLTFASETHWGILHPLHLTHPQTYLTHVPGLAEKLSFPVGQ